MNKLHKVDEIVWYFLQLCEWVSHIIVTLHSSVLLFESPWCIAADQTAIGWTHGVCDVRDASYYGCLLFTHMLTISLYLGVSLSETNYLWGHKVDGLCGGVTKLPSLPCLHLERLMIIRLCVQDVVDDEYIWKPSSCLAVTWVAGSGCQMNRMEEDFKGAVHHFYWFRVLVLISKQSFPITETWHILTSTKKKHQTYFSFSEFYMYLCIVAEKHSKMTQYYGTSFTKL